MNIVLNSDSEQCTESKLGWVHQVRTLAQAARPLRTHCAQAARKASCHDARWVVSWPTRDRVVVPSLSCRRSPLSCCYAHARTGAPCRIEATFCPRSRYKIVSRPNPCRARARPYNRPCRSTLLPCHSVVSQPCCAILRHNCSPSATIQCFASRLPLVKPCTCALPPALHAGQPYRGPLMAVSWHRLSRVVTESWPYRGPWLRTHACCVTIQFPLYRDLKLEDG